MEFGLLLTDNISKRREEFEKKGINYSVGIDVENLFTHINILEIYGANEKEIIIELKKKLLLIMGKIKIEQEKNGNEKSRNE